MESEIVNYDASMDSFVMSEVEAIHKFRVRSFLETPLGREIYAKCIQRVENYVDLMLKREHEVNFEALTKAKAEALAARDLMNLVANVLSECANFEKYLEVEQ